MVPNRHPPLRDSTLRLSNSNRRFARRLRLITVLAIGCGCLATTAYGQVHYDFEQSVTTWRLREADCTIAGGSWLQRRSAEERHSGKTSEWFHFQTGYGTKILVAHSIPAAYLIDELQPKIWVKSTRANIRLMLRVVLPHAPSPDGSGPIKVMIEGDAYQNVGTWQQLTLASTDQSLMNRFQQQLWLLRTKYGADIDPREAYTDLVVLNLYSAPGACDVWVDDLQIDGIASAEQIAQRVAADDRRIVDPLVQQVAAVEATQDSRIRFDGNIMELNGQPFLARVIQHNGEPFDFLKNLGFNTIELKTTADLAQLRQAAQLNLWLVCPPPPDAGLQPIGPEYDRVLVWSVGRNLDARDLQRVKSLVQEITNSDSQAGRPSIADVQSHWSDYAATVDILSVGVATPGGSFPLHRYDQWIAERQVLVGRHTPLWANIATEIAPEIQTQMAALSLRLPPIPLDARQLEAAMFEAAAGGARGLRFLSRSRLDASDPATLLRAQIIKWLNIGIDQCEPWIAGGAALGRLPLSNSGLDVMALQTAEGRLLLVQRISGMEQWVAGDLPLEKVSFVDVGASSADQAYWLSPAGIVPLPVSNVHGGAQIEINKCPSHAVIVITESPVLVNQLAAAYTAASGESFSQLRADICRNWLAISQLVDREMGRIGRSTTSASAAINSAIRLLQQSDSMSQRNNLLLSDEYLNEVEQQLALARRDFLAAAREPFVSRGASPLLVHPLLVPNHWELAQRLGAATWQPNTLAGGDFENLEHLLASGWKNQKADGAGIQTKVELTPDAALGGAMGLRLSALAAEVKASVVEATPVWITTGPLPVKSGQIVRIHGWVRVIEKIQGSTDGLMIIDSLGGPALAERLDVAGEWQEFSLYRGVPADTEMTITFALTGLGVVMVDEVTVRIADPPATMAATPLSGEIAR